MRRNLPKPSLRWLRGQGVLVSGGVFGHTLDLIAQGICRRAHVTPVVDGDSGQNLTYAWSLNTGPAAVQFTGATLASTQANFTAAGAYSLRLTVNDGVSTSSGLTTVNVGLPSGSGLYLSPSASGPNATGTPTTLQAKLVLYFNGYFTQAGGQVLITVTGANPQTATLVTDANGIVTFTYTGINPGTDMITATSGGTQYVSNTVPVTWIAAPPKFTSGPVTGRFFTADGKVRRCSPS
ncbi:MAG: hypothetical protein ABJF23_25400 [Bryobacteraceae bacterium]